MKAALLVGTVKQFTTSFKLALNLDTNTTVPAAYRYYSILGLKLDASSLIESNNTAIC